MITEGDRVELVQTDDEYTDLEPGDAGTVTMITSQSLTPDASDSMRKFWVDWDNGSKLAMLEDVDEIKKVNPDEE